MNSDAAQSAIRRGVVCRFWRGGKTALGFGVGRQGDGRLAVASVVLITTQFAGTPYEVTLPRVPWLREQSYVNAQSIQPVRFTELTRKAPGQFQPPVMAEVKTALSRWLVL
jgi:mRNA-degrading endonuclease toxin of MazEF toxin-antitoxin module